MKIVDWSTFAFIFYNFYFLWIYKELLPLVIWHHIHTQHCHKVVFRLVVYPVYHHTNKQLVLLYKRQDYNNIYLLIAILTKNINQINSFTNNIFYKVHIYSEYVCIITNTQIECKHINRQNAEFSFQIIINCCIFLVNLYSIRIVSALQLLQTFS